MSPHLTRHNVLVQRQLFQNLPIKFAHPLRRQRRVPVPQALADAIARGRDVVHLLSEIFLRRWQFQLALQARQHFLFRKRVAFNGGSRERALREIKLVQRLRDRRAQRYAGNVLAFGRCFAEQQPQRGRGFPQIYPKSNPRMCPFKCPHICPAILQS